MTQGRIFITGAASGIGRATARLFAARGWYTGLYDIDEEGARRAADEIGGDAIRAGGLDVTDPASVSAALDDFAGVAGEGLEVLFNCAGVLEIGAFESIPLERHHRIIDVNLKGLINCSHAALPRLRAGRDPHVVNMSSASAVYGTPDLATYSATKFAVRGLTEALEIEWARHGVTVCDVMPPYVDTPMVRNAAHTASIDRLGVNLTPEAVAGTVWRAAHGRRTHWPMGAQFRILEQIQRRLLPARANRGMLRRITGY